MGQPGLGAGGLMVEVRDRTRESFQRLASAELPVEEVEDFSLYRTLVEQDPLPYSDALHHDYLRAFAREGPAAPGSQAVRTRAVGLRARDRTPPQGGRTMTQKQGLIPCSEAVRQLWDYLDHAVSPEDHEKAEQHLSFCRRH
jgi:Putative zinc-finger